MAYSMFVIDYDDNDGGVSGYYHVVANNAQEAVNEFESCMPDTCVIDGVYKAVQNWKQRRKKI